MSEYLTALNADLTNGIKLLDLIIAHFNLQYNYIQGVKNKIHASSSVQKITFFPSKVT